MLKRFKANKNQPETEEIYTNTTPLRLLSDPALTMETDIITTDDDEEATNRILAANLNDKPKLNELNSRHNCEVVLMSDTERNLSENNIGIKVKPTSHQNRDTWDKKMDFLLSVIGFAVDLGNVWRFPYICFKNGGGAFLIPYIIMYIFGGLPLFFLELALGQYQRCGCLTVWRRICPMFRGIGYGICVIATYTAWYYNTIMAWSLYYLVESIQEKLPWTSCGNPWNTNSCITLEDKINFSRSYRPIYKTIIINNTVLNITVNETLFSSTEEYFYRRVLHITDGIDFNNVGQIEVNVVLALIVIFTIVYFSLWKGVKSSGKAVWITATTPYVVLLILLVRGALLPGSGIGIKYYLKPNMTKLWEKTVWIDAAAQIFFSLGPGFGVLLALSSYSKFRNNCYQDALITSAINCITSFIAGFVVFSVLGHMCWRLNKRMDDVADQQAGLVFIAYPEAIASLTGSVVWSILFFIMLISLGLDSTFGGLEALITGILDEWPRLRKRRELFVLLLIIYCFIGSLATTTQGGFLILNWLDKNGAPISILFIVFCECVALCWFYGIKRFSDDVESMLGFQPPTFWKMCWTYISPAFLLIIFLTNVISYETAPITVMRKDYEFPPWSKALACLVVLSSIINIPIFMIITFLNTKGNFKERMRQMITPEPRPLMLDRHYDEGNAYEITMADAV
uniref:Transporter n=1 Tax=Schmidtea mediterranea TaxID=79327 RepID=S5WMZ4_SCHMD|nr:sert [Schmidtea mediterranea]AHB51758.1 serotonin transporter [Schmidtea mediterranea]AKN21424.1 slc6a-4 [Schmidtea mediterranea]